MSDVKLVRKRSLNQRYATGMVKIFEVDKETRAERKAKFHATFDFHIDIEGFQRELEGEEYGNDIKTMIDIVQQRCAGFKRKAASEMYGAEWDVYGQAEYEEYYA